MARHPWYNEEYHAQVCQSPTSDYTTDDEQPAGSIRLFDAATESIRLTNAEHNAAQDEAAQHNAAQAEQDEAETMLMVTPDDEVMAPEWDAATRDWDAAAELPTTSNALPKPSSKVTKAEPVSKSAMSAKARPKTAAKSKALPKTAAKARSTITHTHGGSCKTEAKAELSDEDDDADECSLMAAPVSSLTEGHTISTKLAWLYIG